METEDLERFLPKESRDAEFHVSAFDPKILVPSTFGVKYAIMNCCTQYYPGEHWMLLIISPDRFELFDPLAFGVLSEWSPATQVYLAESTSCTVLE